MNEFALYVGIASKEKFTHATHNALARLYAELPFPHLEDIEPVGGLVLARNQIAARFLAHERKPSHLLLVDDDVAGFTAADVERMMRSGEDVIGGPLPSRAIEVGTIEAAIKRGITGAELLGYLSPLLMQFLPNKIPVRGHLAEVKAVSTGFLLLSRAALERMVQELGGATAELEGRPIVTVFDFAVDGRGQWVGEDFGFCERWRSLGGKVYADLDTTLLHLGQQAFGTAPLRERVKHLVTERDRERLA